MIFLACQAAQRVHAADFKMAEAAIARGEYETALTNLQPLAAKGKADAQYLLGTLYANGDGVDQDDAKAAAYFRAAAAKGNKLAAQQLVAMFRMGNLDPPPMDEGWRVQLASVQNQAVARREWRRLIKLYGDILEGVNMITVPHEDGERLRLQGGPLDEAVARSICAAFKGTTQTCRAVRPPQPEETPQQAASPPT